MFSLVTKAYQALTHTHQSTWSPTPWPQGNLSQNTTHMPVLHSLLLMTQHAYSLPCKGTKHPQVTANIKETPGTHHFTPPTAKADVQPAAQELN